MTTLSRRHLLRAAGRIHDEYHRRQDAGPLPLLPVPTWEQCVFLARQVDLARQRGFVATAARLRRELVRELDSLSQRSRETAQAVREGNRPSPVPSLRLLYEELASLPDEFEHVDLCLRSGEITVTTEPVTLEEVHLGPFEIHLNAGGLSRAQAYSVVPLEPHPAATDSDTPHPHVQGERLCEGDARPAIREALQSGRLADVLLIVAQTLKTYNAESAYITLADWEGVSCTECGDTVDPEEILYCQRCSTACCCDCTRSCENCSDGHCHECVDRCSACEETFCTGCLALCADCEALQCPDCLTEGRCADCISETDAETDTDTNSEHEEQDHADQDRATTTPAPADVCASPPEAAPPPSPACTPPACPAPAASAAVHTDRLGQAAAPA